MDIRQRLARDRRDQLLALGVAAAAAGFVIIGLAWNGAASKDTIQEQFPYVLSGGIAGLGLVVLGSALVVLQSFRRDHDRVSAELAQLREALGSLEGAAPQPKLAIAGGAGLVVAGRASYHRPDCRLAAGREGVEYLPVAEAAARDLAPCRVCNPPAPSRGPGG